MRSLTLTLLTLLFLVSSHAQTAIPYRATDYTVGVSYLRPVFGGSNADLTGFVMTLSGSVPMAGGTTLILELPFMDGTFTSSLFWVDGATTSSYGWMDQTAFRIGNPYLGLQFGPAESAVYGDVGVRVPIVDRHSIASDVATLTDFRRFEAYNADVLQLSAAANVFFQIAPTTWLRGRLGPDALFHMGDRSSSDLYAEYLAAVEIRNHGIAVGFGYAARTLVGSYDLGRRTVDDYVVDGSYRIEHAEIGVTLHYPIDRRWGADYSWGAGLRLHF